MKRPCRQLEDELHATQQDLQSTIGDLQASNEELRVANEEVVSSNEELQSTNEELETSKEELQSVNEELITVNSQLQDKVEKLDKANADMANFLESTQIATLFLDRELRIKLFTPATTRLLKLIPSDTGRPVSDLSMSFLDYDLPADARAVAQDGSVVEREVTGADGSVYLVRVLPYHAQPDRVDGVVVTFGDVTRLRRAEKQTRRLATVVMDSNDAVILVDLDGGIQAWNRGAERLYGWSEAEALGMNLRDLTPPDQSAEAAGLMHQLGAGETIASFETQRLTKDGRVLDVWLTATAVRDEAGKVETLATTERDITEFHAVNAQLQDSRRAALNLMDDAVSARRQAEQVSADLRREVAERQRAQEALRELNTTLESKVVQRTAELQHRAEQLQKLTLELSETEDRERRHLAEILHDDLQQQLAAAKFHLSLLNNRAKHDPSQLAIVTQVDQMLMEAVQKSRSLSHELSPAVLYQGDFAGALTWLAGQLQTKHGLEVKVDAFGAVRVHSDALKSFLYKAAQELLFNVVKHARVNRARIRVRRLRHCICLSVSDQGRGFDPQDLRQATGFGLLSIRERIELLGGRMKIHSAKGRGSTFHVVVPDGEKPEDRGQKTEGGKKAHEESPSSVLGRPSSILRVLLADDHAIVREGLISLLSGAGDIEVVGEAANGREAVDLAYRLQPDVIIMDVAMPLINGDDATRQIKTRLPQTRVIALSLYAEPNLVEKMRRAGAEGYILKTAPAEELLAAIRGEVPDS